MIKLFSLLAVKEKRSVNSGRFFVFLMVILLLPAGSFAADPKVDQRLQRLERMLDNQNLMQMLQSLQSLQKEVSELRGDVEVMSFELDKLKKQQKDIYIDIDQRLQSTDQAIANIQTAPPALGFSSPQTGDGAGLGDGSAESDVVESLGEQESYQAALSVLKSGRYEDAIQAYQVFLITYPESSFAANAQYWMAEAYYVLKDFQSAISQFQKVVTTYSDSRKVSDAHLKIGFSYYELKEWKNAQSALEKVVAEYSTSTAARLAQRRIQKMKLEGNI